MVVVVIVLHVVHSPVIALTEAFAELVASFSFDGWVFIYFMVIGIGVAMLAVVMSRGFNALVKTALLCIAISRRWCVPVVVVLVLRGTGKWLGFMSIGFECAGGCDAEGKQGWCDTFNVHRIGTSTYMA